MRPDDLQRVSMEHLAAALEVERLLAHFDRLRKEATRSAPATPEPPPRVIQIPDPPQRPAPVPWHQRPAAPVERTDRDIDDSWSCITRYRDDEMSEQERRDRYR